MNPCLLKICTCVIARRFGPSAHQRKTKMEPVEQITPETTTVEPTVEPVAEPVTETVNEPVVEVIEEKDVHPDAVVEEKKEEEETVKEEGEEQKKEGEEKAEEEVETWKMIGNVCLTPCGHGVLSTRTEDDRAGVLLIASYAPLSF